MSSQSSLYGEIREQHRKMKDMSLKGKLEYFWYYYKIHTFAVIAVIILAGTFIYQLATSKDSAFYAVFISSDTFVTDEQTWDVDFAEYAGIDTDKYSVVFDTSFTFSNNGMADYTMSSIEKLVAMASAGMIDIVVADTAAFEKLARSEFYLNLEEALPQETLEKFRDYLYYTDAAAFDDGYDDAFQTLEEIQNPDEYIILPADSKIMEAGCYNYLAANGTTYQGYPSEAVFGIPATTEHLDTIVQFLDFIMEK